MIIALIRELLHLSSEIAGSSANTVFHTMPFVHLVPDFGFQLLGFRFRVSGSGFRVEGRERV